MERSLGHQGRQRKPTNVGNCVTFSNLQKSFCIHFPSSWQFPYLQAQAGYYSHDTQKRRQLKSIHFVRGRNLPSHFGLQVLSCRAVSILVLSCSLSLPGLHGFQQCELVQIFPGLPSLKYKMRTRFRTISKTLCP